MDHTHGGTMHTQYAGKSHTKKKGYCVLKVELQESSQTLPVTARSFPVAYVSQCPGVLRMDIFIRHTMFQKNVCASTTKSLEHAFQQ